MGLALGFDNNLLIDIYMFGYFFIFLWTGYYGVKMRFFNRGLGDVLGNIVGGVVCD